MDANDTSIILIADDDPDDVLLLQQAFQRNGLEMPVHHCFNGAEAISYLKGEPPFNDRQKHPFPRVLITDLKMPKCSGFELLEWLDAHPECSVVPTIVLSGSAEESDVQRAFRLGANSYFQKPSSFNDLVALVKLLTEYWLKSLVPELPEK